MKPYQRFGKEATERQKGPIPSTNSEPLAGWLTISPLVPVGLLTTWKPSNRNSKPTSGRTYVDLPRKKHII